MKYFMKLKAVGNPDYGQYASPCPPRSISATTLEELHQKVVTWRDEFGLGGGNWASPEVLLGETKKAATVFGYMSYNGRIWAKPPAEWKPGDQPIFDPSKA